MAKPNRTHEEDARVRARLRQADKEHSFLWHQQRAQDMARQGQTEEPPLDRDEIYQEARKEEARLKEMAAKQGKLRLDIESDATKEKTPPILTTEEATKK